MGVPASFPPPCVPGAATFCNYRFLSCLLYFMKHLSRQRLPALPGWLSAKSTFRGAADGSGIDLTKAAHDVIGYWCEQRQSPLISNELSIMQQFQVWLCILHERLTGFKNQTEEKGDVHIRGCDQPQFLLPSCWVGSISKWSFWNSAEEFCYPVALPLWALGSLFHLNLCLIYFQLAASPHKTYLRPAPVWISHVCVHRSGALVLVLAPLRMPVAEQRCQRFFREI